MSTISIHGARTPDGRAGGKPRTGAMSSRDPVVAARLARSVVQAGEWRSLPARSEQNRILMAIAAKAQWAVRALTPDAVSVLPAVGKEKPQGGCDWCAAAVQRSPEPELDHHDPVNLALLGNPCGGCQQRWRKAEAAVAAAQQERAHVADLVAAGYSAEDAPYERPGDRRPTGILWAAGQEPSGLVAAARQAARKIPPPSYYRPGRPR